MSAEPRILPANTREEWLQERKAGIGCSEIAAILGLNPWRSPLDVYLDKIGEGRPQEETRPMRLGKAFEPAILAEYTKETGREARLNDRLFQHPDVPMLGTPDAFELEELPPPGVEMKATRNQNGWGESGTDEIPDVYLPQVAGYMAILNRPFWHVAALIAGGDFRVYTVRRDAALEAVILENVARFWRDNVIAHRAPDPDGSASAGEWVREKFPRHTSMARVASPEESDLLRLLVEAKDGREAAEREEERLKQLVQMRIGDAEGLIFDGGKCTWKTSKDSVVTDWKAVAAELTVPVEVVNKHTNLRPGSRRFVLTVKE